MSEIKIKVYIGDYFHNSTINANIHPEKQIEKLLHYLNKEVKNNNQNIEIYTNSPYILNKLMILQIYHHKNVKCEYFEHKIIECDVFEITLEDEIIEVPKYKYIVSDDNLLNNMINQSNKEHAEILEICQKRK